jgi:hypothetical protein
VVSLRDLLLVVSRPVVAVLVASGVVVALGRFFPAHLSPFIRLSLDCAALFTIYLGILMYVTRQKTFYLDVLRGMKKGSPSEGKVLASV